MDVPLRKWTLVLAAAALPAGVLGGCQNPPRVVIADLPVDSILRDGGAPRTPAPPPPVHASVGRPAPRVPAEWIPSGHERPWRWIVIHHSATDAGSAAVFDRSHRARGFDELGYHFVIDNGRGGRDGAVEVGSRWRKQKWGAHCGGTPNNEYNNYGIGICLVGDFTRRMPSSAQLRSLRRLVAFLMERYEIPPARVIGHCDAPNARTQCPGAALHRYLTETLRPSLPRPSRLAHKR